MTAPCDGNCGRPGAGPFDFGRPGGEIFTFCDSCWLDLHHKQRPPGLRKTRSGAPGRPGYAPYSPPALPSSPRELSALTGSAHKVIRAETKTTAMAPPVTGTGTFTGYLAGFGRDHSGDQIMGAAAVADTVAEVNAGRIQWHITDSHSEKASDVVATVTAAAADRRGVRISANWAPGETAQRLRAMARAGHQLGLSIDYLVDAARPDGAGGRFLDRITIIGGAVTPKPMNAAAVITEGKAAPWSPVADVFGDVQARSQRDDPQRRQDERILAAAPWPPPGLFDRETSLGLARGAAAAKAARMVPGDGEAARQARWQRANAYSHDLSEWLDGHRASR